MGELQRYLGTNPAAITQQIIHAEPGAFDAKSNIIALALVRKNTLPNFGTSYTYGTVPTTVTLDGPTIVDALRDGAFAGTVRFFPDNTVNGKQTLVEELKAKEVWGSEAENRRTGDVKIRCDITYRDSAKNVEFFNALRNGELEDFDIYQFTDRTVELIRFDEDSPVFHDIKAAEKSGSYTDDITGAFSYTFIRRGEPSPRYGVDRASLKKGFAYTFAAATTPTNLTASGADRYKVTAAGTIAKITRTVLPTGGAVTYQIAMNGNQPIPSTIPVTIDSLTGEITFASTLAAGTYRFTVTAENAVGVWGKYNLVIVV